MTKTKIMIADDHALVREGIAALLNFHDDYRCRRTGF